MNLINYLKHTVYKPNTYFRRFDFDVSRCPDQAKRIALAALPFVAMYGPAGALLSAATNGSRIISHSQVAIEENGKKNWKNTAAESGKVAFAILALSVSLFHFSTGLLVSTSSDVVQGIHQTVQALLKAEYCKAGEEALQTLASSAYLTFLISGSLEAMVLFALLQTATSLSQAREEIKAGHYIEATAKISLAAFKLQSAGQYISSIQRRNAFLKMERTAALFIKLAKARQAHHLIHHPLSSLKERIEEKDLVLRDEKGKEIHFGAHFHGNGKSLVKGENIAFRTRNKGGKEVIELEFKINHAFRDQLQKSIDQLKKVSLKEMKEILTLAGSHASGVSIQAGSFSNLNLNPQLVLGQAQQINVEGLGTILVGAASDQPNLYDKVVVQIDANQTLFSLHEMLCLVDLSDALCLSTKEDVERLKMGHLFRTFFPQEALNFERSTDFFSLPLDTLKEKMIEKVPKMEEIFGLYYHRMKPEAIIGGRIRYRIEGLAEAAFNQGARALTAAITGAYSDAELFERVASIIRSGMLSSEVRHGSQLQKNGLSSGYDYLTGGADSVYTQLLTAKACKDNLVLNQFYYYSKVRFLISLDALELGTYQYHNDNFGSRLAHHDNWKWLEEFYAKRESILDFVRQEQLNFRSTNEVMIKERLPASFFKGLIISDEQTKSKLIAYLQKCKLIENNSILNIPVDQFLRVGTHLSEELIA